MAFVFPEGLAPEVYPLAWLVGTWHGQGAMGYPGIEESAIEQDVVFTHDGGPYLAYAATTRLIDEQGEIGRVWHTESGYWRVVPSDQPEIVAQAADQSEEKKAELGDQLADAGQAREIPGNGRTAQAGKQRSATPIPREIEVLIADPAGAVSVYIGQIEGPRITIATDLMAHTPSGAEMNAGRRLYGLVDSDLLWAWDLAAFGQPLQSYMSARLKRVGEQTDTIPSD